MPCNKSTHRQSSFFQCRPIPRGNSEYTEARCEHEQKAIASRTTVR